MTRLRSAINGLTYPPYLRGEPADVATNAYAARVLDDLGAGPVRISAATSRKALVHEARAYGPVTGRWLLLPFVADLSSYVADVSAIRRHRAAQGWYFDSPKSPAESRTVATLRALTALNAVDALDAEDRSATGPWLRSRLRSTDLQEVAAAAEALALLGFDVPKSTPLPVVPPMTGFTKLSQEQRSDLLAQTDAVVRIHAAAGRTAPVDVVRWDQVFKASVHTLPVEDLDRLVRLLLAGGVAPRALTAAARRLQADRMPGGMFRDSISFAGDPSTSLYALALREFAHESTKDASLAAGARAATLAPGDSDAVLRLVVDAVRALASGSDPGSAADQCSVETPIGLDTVAGWKTVGLACRLLGKKLAAPKLARWSQGSAAGTVAAARLTNTLTDADLEVPGWVDAKAMAVHLAKPLSLGSIENVAEVARAVHALHVDVPAGVQARVEETLGQALGCPGFTDLVRAVPGDLFSCDLPTTLAVRQWRAVTR